MELLGLGRMAGNHVVADLLKGGGFPGKAKHQNSWFETSVGGNEVEDTFDCSDLVEEDRKLDNENLQV